MLITTSSKDFKLYVACNNIYIDPRYHLTCLGKKMQNEKERQLLIHVPDDKTILGKIKQISIFFLRYLMFF